MQLNLTVANHQKLRDNYNTESRLTEWSIFFFFFFLPKRYIEEKSQRSKLKDDNATQHPINYLLNGRSVPGPIILDNNCN